MENKQQTAVDWFYQRILAKDIKKVYEQAKAMENMQHRNTWEDSRIESKGDDYIGKEKTFEEYYKETYGE